MGGWLLLLLLLLDETDAFQIGNGVVKTGVASPTRRPTALPLGSFFASGGDNKTKKLSNLPRGISPFEKGLSKSLDVQGEFRAKALTAWEAATAAGILWMEVEFPPLIGGARSKTQFDDFDNVQELEANAAWTLQWAPLVSAAIPQKKKNLWLVFPDAKECQVARTEWQGSRYQEAATWTTIEAATQFLTSSSSSSSDDSSNSAGAGATYEKPWGATLAAGLSQLWQGGGGGDFLGQASSLDELVEEPSCCLFVQPGNGGPVEDWVNLETIAKSTPTTTVVVMNGALDKVRDGYYPAIFFPRLAQTVPRFYNQFESIFYLKPLVDKGSYGWLYRVYPEPWQVVLQTPLQDKKGRAFIEDTVVFVSETRPSYQEALDKLVQAAASSSSSTSL